MPDRKVVKEWIEKAESDYKFACMCLQDTAGEFFSQICFHFQQDAQFSKLTEECEFLIDFYIDTRYPVHWPTTSTYTEDEVKRTKESVDTIRGFVKEKLLIA